MESEITALWNVLLWGLGICSVGFFTLLGITLKTSLAMGKPLQEIRDALLGSLKKPVGLIHEFSSMTERVERIEKRCEERPAKCKANKCE